MTAPRDAALGARWNRLELRRALELSGEERAGFLDAQGGGDVALRTELDTLLEAPRRATTNLASAPP